MMSAYAKNEKNKALWMYVPLTLFLLLLTVTVDVPRWFVFILFATTVYCAVLCLWRVQQIENEDATDMLRSGVWREKFYQIYDQLLKQTDTTSVLTTWHVYYMRNVDSGVYFDMRNTVDGNFTTLFIMYPDAYEDYLNGIFLEGMEAPPKGTHCWDAYVEIFERILKKVEDQPRDAVRTVLWGLFECGMSTISFGENWRYERGVCITGEILVGNKPFELIPMKLIFATIEILKT